MENGSVEKTQKKKISALRFLILFSGLLLGLAASGMASKEEKKEDGVEVQRDIDFDGKVLLSPYLLLIEPTHK